MRKLIAALLSATMWSGAASAATTTFPVTFAGVANTMTVSDASGGGESYYPLQFGRPFVQGAIPAGQLPQVLVNGTAVPTQADVKNRYPDGSVEYAVIAVVIQAIPANGSVTLSFQPTTSDSNTPLTAAQMEDASYNFDAAINLVVPAVTGQTPSASITAPNGSLTVGSQTITFSPTIGGDGNYPVLFNGAANGGALSAYVIGGSLYVLNAQNEWFEWNGTGYILLTANPITGTPGANATADARAMLANGDYKLWTSGPVAQTILLGDDTAARKYDLSLGDSYHPFRPRFEATFWPTSHQVFVRAIGEDGLTTELEDVGPYNLTITGGQSSPATEESLNGYTQDAMETWTKSFWLGGTPQPEVNVDNNLAYLESTRWVPNYDPSLTIPQATIASDYANWWTNTSHDINGTGGWNPGMASTGPRPDIGPEPGWDTAWLYSGDWRLRATALGNADLAAQWPVNLRESATGYRLNSTDPAGSSTGLGLPPSQADRGALGPNGFEGGGEGYFLGTGSGTSSALKEVGALCINSSTQTACNGWNYASTHEPSPFFIPYVLTGDPFYLTEMENWAAYDQFANWQVDRGPTGGMADNELRGDGFMLLRRAETAFAAPDSDPLKPYLTTLTQSDIAAWEGAMGVTDPALSSTAEYTWAKGYGDPESQTNFGSPPPAPTLGQWAASLPTGASPTDFQGQMASVNATAFTENFMNWYVIYSVGRTAELGFAAKPLALYSGAYLTGLLNSPDPTLIASYFMPAMLTTGQITSFPALIASLATPWLTGVNYTGGSSQGALPTQFQASLYAQGYNAYAIAALSPLVDEGAPGAATAETWLKTNVYQVIDGVTAPGGAGLAVDPTYAIVPRIDHNTLPAQPLGQP